MFQKDLEHMERKHCRHRTTFATIFFNQGDVQEEQSARTKVSKHLLIPLYIVSHFLFVLQHISNKQTQHIVYASLHISLCLIRSRASSAIGAALSFDTMKTYFEHRCVYRCVCMGDSAKPLHRMTATFSTLQSHMSKNIWYIKINIFLLGPRPSKMWLLIMIVEWIINRIIF